MEVNEEGKMFLSEMYFIYYVFCKLDMKKKWIILDCVY